jgi:nitrogen fixation/metabolism regulation signal transduction histidine kinase
MDPIFVILYAVILTLVLTLVLPRVRQVSPLMRRFLWITFAVGAIAFLVVAYIVFT